MKVSISIQLLLTTITVLQLFTAIHGQSISVNKSCVKPGETFAVTFQNKDQVDTDWVAITPCAENPRNFFNIAIWVWTCGSQTCDGAVAQGRIRMRANNIANGSWRAVLARDDNDAPFSSYAQSSCFTISTSCGPTAPVRTPVAAPTSNPNTLALKHMEDAKKEIIGLINNDNTLAPTFMRLGFHDCIGGCDGCIDIDNHDNAGLSNIIDLLQPIVNRHGIDGFSRGDIWALAATVGADVSQRSDSRVDMTLKWWGRVDCEKTGQTCKGPNGETVSCNSKKGPHHQFPNIHMHTAELYSFFKDGFGFSQRDTVAIMGAHTLGRIRKENFNIDAPNGWVPNNRELSNQYYEELCGGQSPNDPIDVLINDAPAWRRFIEFGTRSWVGRPDGLKIIMLNTDIAVVRNLDSSNMDKSIGRVSCAFEDNSARQAGVSVCPHVEGALQIACTEFFHDNLGWLRTFRDVLDRMLTNKYKRNSCSDKICKLSK